MYEEDDLLNLSGIQHFSYCRRQWALIHIGQVWNDNYHTFKGQMAHKNAHDEQRKESRGSMFVTRGLEVHSLEHGYAGKCDVVEFHKDPNGIMVFGKEGTYSILPIEYKSGPLKLELSDRLQLAAEAIALEEMFYTAIPYGYLFYKQSNKRVEVKINDELRSLVKQYFQEMHQYLDRGYIPKVKPDRRCENCSLKDVCGAESLARPSASAYLQKKMEEMLL